MLKQSKIVIYALLALLLVGVFYSLKVGIADIYAHQADRLERRWIKHGEVKSFKDWQQANSWVDKALWLDGDHPDYLLTKGRLATWRFFVTKDGTGIEQLKQQAMPGLGFIESSIAVRPGWPYAWSTLVRLKAQLGELDERFYFAFEQAKVLGTWEPDVQMTLFDVGLGAWASLPWSERFYILELFNTLLERAKWASKGNKVFEIAKAHQMVPAMCLSLDITEHAKWVQKRCRSEMATSE